MSNPETFKFPLIDNDGSTISDPGLWGKLGFSEKYHGELHEDDDLITAIRLAASGAKSTVIQQALLRSFSLAWLTGRAKSLGKVAAFGVELPKSVNYISQVGFLDRTASAIVSTTLTVAACVIYLDLTWELIAADPMTMTPTESGSLLLKQAAGEAAFLLVPSPVIKQIEKQFGVAGTPTKRSAFSSEPILSMLRLCRLRSMIQQFGFSEEYQQGVENLLDQRIFALFLANSRQIEGLCLSGKSEASAAIAAHAAIALGIYDLSTCETTLDFWQKGIIRLESEAQRTEAFRTLDSIRTNLAHDFAAIDRQLNRQLVSASTTAAVALMTAPVGASFQLMAMVAGTLEGLAPDGHFKMLFSTMSGGFKTAQNAAASAPSALATAIDGSISAEAWTRKTVSELWPFKNPD